MSAHVALLLTSSLSNPKPNTVFLRLSTILQMMHTAQQQLLYPPYRFSYFQEDITRGGWPKPRNLDFLKSLGLKTILSLTPMSLQQVYPNIEKWALDQEIQLIHVKVDAPKEDSVPLTWHKVIQILTIMIDSTNLPLYVHCLDGTTVSMVTLACLRKLEGWNLSSTLSEALRFTKDEVISHDERLFIEGFKDFGEIGPPLISRLPKWLWGGGAIPFKKHPHLKIKFINQAQDQLKSTIATQVSSSGVCSGISTTPSSSSPSANASVSVGSALIGSHPLGGVDSNGFMISSSTPTSNPVTVQSPLLQSSLPPHFPDTLPPQQQISRTSVSRGTLVHTHSSHSFSTRVSLTDHQTMGSVSVSATGAAAATGRQQSMLSSQIIPSSDSPIDESNRSVNMIGSRGGPEGGGPGSTGQDEDDLNGNLVKEFVPIRVSRTIMALDLELGNQK